MSPILAFRNVSVAYGGKVVLEKLSLGIEEGAFVSIVGPLRRDNQDESRATIKMREPSRVRAEGRA